jgi:hypothetical protein
MGSLPAGLIRPTTRPEAPEPVEADDPPAVDEDEAQGGRGEATPEIRQPKSRAKRKPPQGESKGRKIGLPDDVHDRLWQYARSKRITVSAAATDILNRNLPRYKIEREG